jgi:hypothetical protein
MFGMGFAVMRSPKDSGIHVGGGQNNLKGCFLLKYSRPHGRTQFNQCVFFEHRGKTRHGGVDASFFVQKCHWIIKEKVLCSINDGFKAPLKLVEVLKDILAIKTGNFYIAND